MRSRAAASGRCGVTGCDRCVFDRRVSLVPERCVVSVSRCAAGIHADGSVESFTQDVGVSGVARGVRQAMDHHVEQRHVLLPPRHVSHRVEPEGSDRRVGVAPDPFVQADDVGAAFVLGRPEVGSTSGRIIPAREGFGERSIEDLAEVPGVPDRVVLDQTNKVGARRRQRTTNVIVREPIESSAAVSPSRRRPHRLDHGPRHY